MIPVTAPNPRSVRALLASPPDARELKAAPMLRAHLRAGDYSAALASLLRADGGAGLLGTSSKVERAGGFVGGRDVLTSVVYLAPASVSPGATLCPYATPGCLSACLAENTGRMSMPNVAPGRTRKALLFRLFPMHFVAGLQREIRLLARRAARLGKAPAVRLNGTSDIRWERFRGALMDTFPGVSFYDYTKAPARSRRLSSLPENYVLTFSVSERAGSLVEARRYVEAGHGAAVVVAGSLDTKRDAKRAAASIITLGSFAGMPTSDGDAHDFRPADAGTLSVLYAKGDALTDRSGFVHRIPTTPAARRLQVV